MRTYGSLRLSVNSHPEHFVLTPEPHVMIRLKRVFERIEKASYGTARLTATEENAFELDWFLKRYPLEASAAARARLRALVTAYRRRRRVVESVLRLEGDPMPFPLAEPAREYQAVAAELAIRSGSLLLADDVGLGKTVTAIAMLTDPRTRPALCVVYPHLQLQWKAMLTRFAPALRTHVLRTGKSYDLSRAAGGHAPDVLITTYTKLAGWADALAPVIRGLVFDEVQELRTGHGSLKYAAAAHLAAGAFLRTGLSATPIYNYGGELWNVLDVLAPGRLGTSDEFQREWCGGYGNRRIGKAAVAEPRALGKYLREEGLMLRRTRKDVGRELPGCSVAPYQVDADLDALEDVSVEASDLARIVLAQGGHTSLEKFRAAGELDWRLRQATGIAKAPYVAAFVRLLVESGESVVLYGWHHAVYEHWLRRLADLSPRFFTGRETPVQRESAKAAFIRGETKLLVLSLRAGAGLDGLQQACRTVVFGELDWSPGVHEQCIGRVYRDGQGEPVMAYYLLAEVGSDPVVADVLGIKAGQIEGLKDPDADLVERLEVSPDHVRRLAEAYLKQHGTPPAPAAAPADPGTAA